MIFHTFLFHENEGKDKHYRKNRVCGLFFVYMILCARQWEVETMKKFMVALSLVFTLLLALGGFSGCGEKNFGALDIVCTIFPTYDWTKNLIDGNGQAKLTLLQDSGIDLHNYQPSAADKVKILKCDLLVYVGGVSDGWVEEMLADPAKNSGMKVVKLLDFVDALGEEEVSGEEQDHDRTQEEKDEHVWLSLKNAHKLVQTLKGALQAADPENSALYEKNANDYTEKIDALEKEYANALKAPARNILLFGDRFPFRYLVNDYGLSYFAAFSGCSAETEASPNTIKRLAQAIEQYDLPYILVLEGSDKSVAEQIKNSTPKKDQTILSINSIQSVTKKQIGDGADFLSLMKENLETLKTALN